MGEVYRADNLKLEQPVALKFLPAALADDPKLLKALYNEVRQAKRVSHPLPALTNVPLLQTLRKLRP